MSNVPQPQPQWSWRISPSTTSKWQGSVEGVGCHGIIPQPPGWIQGGMKLISLWSAMCILIGGFKSSEKYESQLGWLFQIYGKIKNVPNHQPALHCLLLVETDRPDGPDDQCFTSHSDSSIRYKSKEGSSPNISRSDVLAALYITLSYPLVMTNIAMEMAIYSDIPIRHGDFPQFILV